MGYGWIIVVLIIAGLIVYANPQIWSEIKTNTANVINKVNIGSINGNTNLLDLAENPENYYGKEVTLIVNPQIPPALSQAIGSYNNISYSFTLPSFNYYISAKNEEGKPIPLILKYERFYCYKCEITGVIRSFKVCDCQSRYFGSIEFSKLNIDIDYDEDNWEEKVSEICREEIKKIEWKLRGSSWAITTKEYCERPPYAYINLGGGCERTEYRCDPSSIRDFYYLDVTYVKSLD